MRIPGLASGLALAARLPGPRLSAFQAGHIPSWRGLCERYALSPVAAACRWSLLLLSPLLSPRLPAWLPVGLDTWHLGILVLVVAVAPMPGRGPYCCLTRTPPPNPTAAEPDGRRVLSRVGAADHVMTPEAPWTGSGWREYSYGEFGGGHPRFHPHVTPPVARGLRDRLG